MILKLIIRSNYFYKFVIYLEHKQIVAFNLKFYINVMCLFYLDDGIIYFSHSKIF